MSDYEDLEMCLNEVMWKTEEIAELRAKIRELQEARGAQREVAMALLRNANNEVEGK